MQGIYLISYPVARLVMACVSALQVAPVTVQHIFKLVALGAYTGNHIFRVDKGFVAQVADVVGGRNLAMDAQQQVSITSPGSNLQAAIQQQQQEQEQQLLLAPSSSTVLCGWADRAL
jgi:cyclophilin family peptidyl-prolyl cis-trans isomerase